jgi:hypothetical protein
LAGRTFLVKVDEKLSVNIRGKIMITSLIAGMSMLFFTGFVNVYLGYWLLTKSTNNTTKNI